jgi:hypothetical protein
VQEERIHLGPEFIEKYIASFRKQQSDLLLVLLYERHHYGRELLRRFHGDLRRVQLSDCIDDALLFPVDQRIDVRKVLVEGAAVVARQVRDLLDRDTVEILLRKKPLEGFDQVLPL